MAEPTTEEKETLLLLFGWHKFVPWHGARSYWYQSDDDRLKTLEDAYFTQINMP